MRYLQTTNKTAKAKLDAKDKKILSILSSDVRMPLTQLSKKVGLSRDAVSYRINNYEKGGIIQGYRTMVDMSQFGYKANHLFIKLNNPSKSVEEEIVGRLVKHPFVRAVIKFSGDYDLEVAFVTKDIDDLDSVLTTIISDCSDYLHDYELLTISKTFIAETFPPEFPKFKPDRKIKKNEKSKADKKDIEILKILGDDATLPLYKIATKVSLSPDAVSYRMKKMMESGLIVKFVPVINYTSLDYSLYTVLLNICGLDAEKEKILRGFLSADKHTLWAVKTIGRFNVLIYLLVRSIDDLQDTTLKLRSLFPKQINHYETLIAYEEYKYIYFTKGLF